MNVRSVTVFKKRVKQRRLTTGSATKPILKVRRIARRRNTGLIDPERNKEREGLLRSKFRTDFSLQTSSISGKSKRKEILRGRNIPFGCNMIIQVYSRARKRYILCVCSCESSAIYNVICIPPPPPPPPPMYAQYAMQAGRWPVGRTIYISEFCSVHGCYFINGNILHHKCVSTGGPHQTDQSKSARCCMFIQAALVTPDRASLELTP